MTSTRAFLLAALSLCGIFASAMRADPTPAERVAEIEKALQAAKLDGWLFYDFRGSDPLAPRILKLGEHASGSRRWFYYIPATGEPTKIVHSIERETRRAPRTARHLPRLGRTARARGRGDPRAGSGPAAPWR